MNNISSNYIHIKYIYFSRILYNVCAGNTSNIIYQLKLMQINLSQITYLDFDILHQYSERTVSSHDINHNKKVVNNLILKRIFKQNKKHINKTLVSFKIKATLMLEKSQLYRYFI